MRKPLMQSRYAGHRFLSIILGHSPPYPRRTLREYQLAPEYFLGFFDISNQIGFVGLIVLNSQLFHF